MLVLTEQEVSRVRTLCLFKGSLMSPRIKGPHSATRSMPSLSPLMVTGEMPQLPTSHPLMKTAQAKSKGRYGKKKGLSLHMSLSREITPRCPWKSFPSIHLAKMESHAHPWTNPWQQGVGWPRSAKSNQNSSSELGTKLSQDQSLDFLKPGRTKWYLTNP